MSQTRRYRLGIGGRLGVAFALSALLAVVACLVGWFSYERLSLTIRQIGKDDLPATIAAGRLAQVGGAIIASAPLLSQSETADELERVSDQIDQRLKEMLGILGAASASDLERIRGLVRPLSENLAALRSGTLASIAMRGQNDAMLRELRALHADFVDESEPLVDDAHFVMQALLEDIAQRRSDASVAAELGKQLRKSEAILRISSHANLAIGLISRISTVGAPEQLTIDVHFLAETIDLLRSRMRPIMDASDTITIRQILHRLFELAHPDTGLPGLRRQELEQRRRTDRLLAGNRDLVGRLDREIATVLVSASERAAKSGDAAARSIHLGRQLLLLIAFLAVLASLTVGLAYVRSSLIRRIRELADAARTFADGRVPGAIAIRGEDELTDMARAMERFRRTQEELVQSAKLAALGNLSAGIAHEINQPLNAIRSYAHNALVFHERKDDIGLARSLKKIEDLIGRAAHVITHLRRYARRSNIELSSVPVTEAIDGATLLLAARIKDTGATIRRSAPPDLMVHADEIRLEQVFVNLLSNALDAVEGRVPAEVRIEASRLNGSVRVDVIDTGPGITPEVIDRLFDPFVTTKPVGQGLGLGLTISYNIVRDFGGTLRVIPESSGGHFVIDLKAVTEEAAA